MSFYYWGALCFLIHTFYIYLLNIYYVSGIELGLSVNAQLFWWLLRELVSYEIRQIPRRC